MVRGRVCLWSDKEFGDGGFSASEEEFQSPLDASISQDSNVVSSGFQTPEQETTAYKRIRLSPHPQQVDYSEETSPLGLTLSKTPDFLNLVEMKLSQARRKKRQAAEHESRMVDFVSQPMSEKLKASNFTASLLKIGSWERVSRHEGDLVAKCYFAKKKFVWEVLEGALKSKIEIQWSDISAIRAIIRDDEPGVLELELNQPPLFYRETNPQPRKHTLWQQASDFTGGQAPICRRHHALFPAGSLDRHYEKLLQCDHRLLMLSQKPFPSLGSPYFHTNIYRFNNDLSVGLSGYSDFPQRMQYPVQNVPSHLVAPQHHIQDLKPTARTPLGIMDSNSPMSVMDFVDERASNYAFQSQRTALWGQRVNSFAQNVARGEQQGVDSIRIATQATPVLHSQEYHLMNYGEDAGRPSPNNALLGQIEDHLLGDCQVVCSDESSLLARVRSMCSLIETTEGGIPPANNNNIVYDYEGYSNDRLVLNATEHSGVDGGVPYAEPIYWLPADKSDDAYMMTQQPMDKTTYPYVLPQPTMDDIAALDAAQDIHQWTS
ncbi:hypothetical protein RJ640_013762 [Escallonia rubra]|uniref:TRF2/HOY1 PH-like domain-containing protein n=1 Tax=Escallonia rubra TaxID=112253 RepID=A0AA88R9G5_9ASTE|nr:hypothetical protein RJ640_013762 [Escallonia rubra]